MTDLPRKAYAEQVNAWSAALIPVLREKHGVKLSHEMQEKIVIKLAHIGVGELLDE